MHLYVTFAVIFANLTATRHALILSFLERKFVNFKLYDRTKIKCYHAP